MTTYDKLLRIKTDRGAGYLVLLDPDHRSVPELSAMARECEAQGADGFLIGGSLLFSDHFDALVRSIKEAVSKPVILFPGSSRQLSRHADAVLFMSLISGRNPQALIGEQVLAAPLVHALGIETISMGYMLVESGNVTAAQFMSNTSPIPREKPQIAVAHGLAGQYLGMKLLYLEAGSGAEKSVPETMIQAVSHTVSIPVIVGGGIRTPHDAAAKVRAGASFVVTGNVLESEENHSLVRAFAEAIHQGPGDKTTT
ncbi:MAG TPA: geranylgeranylglyceryl/heptaprenylglyceryl phosphate synthase [bacterium]|nr:geranylgeranylglyceryl/heptaprenylglyceryl phosphate synthase [bacterium]